MHKVYIVDAIRSPIGKTNGALAHLRPENMMGQLIKKMNSKYPLAIDDVLIASAVGLGGNLARLSVLEAGLPQRTTATSIDFQCGGALKALEYGFYSVASGQKSMVYVGGVESTSQEPRVFLNPKDPNYHGEIAQARGQFSPLSLGDPDMLEGAENCYQLLKPDHDAIEEIVLRSHLRGIKTTEEGLLKDIICPMVSDSARVDEDEGIRKSMSLRLIRRAKPIVRDGGYTTVANSCLTHDGASLVFLASEEMVKEHALKVLGEIIGIESLGLNPNYSPLGPVVVVGKLLKKYGLSIDDLGAVEVNEAFAVKTWSLEKYLGIPSSILNPLGGALAYGHPYGATGGMLIAHLFKGLSFVKEAYGIATMGVAGGQGIGVLVRRWNETLD